MTQNMRNIASTALAMLVGFGITEMHAQTISFLLDSLYLPLSMILPRQWQESICNLAIIALLGIPIAVVAEKRAAWFGAMAAITSEFTLFWYWLKLEPPRGTYDASYFVGTMFYIAVFAMVSHSWWKFVFQRRNELAPETPLR